jgi:hypothetical protein
MAISAAGNAIARMRRLWRFAALAAAGSLLAKTLAIGELAVKRAFELDQGFGIVAGILIAMLHRTALGGGRIHHRDLDCYWEPSVAGWPPNLAAHEGRHWQLQPSVQNPTLADRKLPLPHGRLHSAEIQYERLRLFVADRDRTRGRRTKTVTSFHQKGETRHVMNHDSRD